MWFNQYPYLNLNDLNLDWIIAHFRDFVESIASLDEWRTTHEAEYEELKRLYDDIVSGNFPDSMTNSLKAWLSRNAIDIIGELVKMVFFGINNDGYFVAYIPESWSDIIFGTTGLDDFPDGIDFGHLTLSFNEGGM